MVNPGDVVTCIDVSPCKGIPPRLTLGKQYTILNVYPVGSSRWLKYDDYEVVNDLGYIYPYFAYRFGEING